MNMEASTMISNLRGNTSVMETTKLYSTAVIDHGGTSGEKNSTQLMQNCGGNPNVGTAAFFDAARKDLKTKWLYSKMSHINLWYGYDRPSPDHANAKFILLVSAHLESGHY